jgi:hypothetical protein
VGKPQRSASSHDAFNQILCRFCELNPLTAKACNVVDSAVRNLAAPSARDSVEGSRDGNAFACYDLRFGDKAINQHRCVRLVVTPDGINSRAGLAICHHK